MVHEILEKMDRGTNFSLGPKFFFRRASEIFKNFVERISCTAEANFEKDYVVHEILEKWSGTHFFIGTEKKLYIFFEGPRGPT